MHKRFRPFCDHSPALRLAARALVGFGNGAALMGKVRVDQLPWPAFAVAAALGAPIGKGVAETMDGRRFASFAVCEARGAKLAPRFMVRGRWLLIMPSGLRW